jgi:hypothetical protein
MPTKPYGRKCPRDTNPLATLMVDMLTGQLEDRELTPEEQGKDPAAVALGRRAGPMASGAPSGACS